MLTNTTVLGDLKQHIRNTRNALLSAAHGASGVDTKTLNKVCAEAQQLLAELKNLDEPCKALKDELVDAQRRLATVKPNTDKV